MTTKNHETNEQQVLASESRRLAAILAANDAELRSTLSPRLVYVHSSGLVEDRDAYIAKLTSGARKYLAFSPRARRFMDLGDTQVCVGEMDVKALAGDKTVDARIAYTAIYAREEGDLRLAGWHACSVPLA